LTSYAEEWDSGHWVVAIGYDDDKVYFEDPWIPHARAYLTWDELDDRWHDLDYDNSKVYRYGAAIWKPGSQGHSANLNKMRHMT
jgi:predicted double-glycine peptidase